MKMGALIRYEVPAEIVALWQRRESEVLLPLQELAVRQHGLFGTGNLLIQAPTSSGKTFIGEMAAIHSALRRKMVVYLVPLKALAEEKYRDFHAKYTPYGLKVIVSTRDRREFDEDLESGNFSIAVVVYEKLAQLLVRKPERMAEIDLVVADELEILSDPERGAMAELLLTRVLRAGRRLVGLSAVIGGADRLAAWMGAQLVKYDRRPVELRYGILHEGAFHYRTHNELGENREPMADCGSDSPWEVLTENVCAMARRGETCLVFVKAKHESRRGAELLAPRVDLPAAQKAIERLRGMERTRARDGLIETLSHGVAFHNADLAPEERIVVEEAFSSGEAKVLISTSTLAVGLNMPAQNVFLDAQKWRYDLRLDIPWKTPLLHMEYENMAGRAGRYGAGHPFGRAILIATSLFDHETLWRRYIDGQREPIEPQLDKSSLEDHVLSLIASRACRTLCELTDFLESTLTGKWIWADACPLPEIEARIRASVNRCADFGVVALGENDGIAATPLGRVIAAKGLTIASARALELWVRETETRPWPDMDLFYAAAVTPEGRMLQFSLTAREYEHADYPGRIKAVTRGEDTQAGTPLNILRRSRTPPTFDEVRAVKIALMLDEWIHERPLSEIEEHHNTMAGQILNAAEQIAWLIDAAAALAATAGADPAFVARVETLRDRVQSGIHADVLPLAYSACGLTRSMLIDLHERRLHTADALSEAILPTSIPRPVANNLKTWANRYISLNAALPVDDACAAPPARSHTLVVDDRHPGGILLDGRRVTLQDRQYRLIRALAARPGECVPYEDIYSEVWGDLVVEDNQIHFQKRQLMDRIQKALPHRSNLVKTIPKRGFMLQLTPEDVQFECLVPAA